jgi:hypothetical protein
LRQTLIVDGPKEEQPKARDIHPESASKEISIGGGKFVECLRSQKPLSSRKKKNRRKTGNVLTEDGAAQNF